MNSRRAKSGPFKEEVFYPDSEIEQIAEEALRLVNLYPDEPSPIRIERFVEKRFGITPQYGQLHPGVLGYTTFGSSGADMVYVSRDLADDPSAVAGHRVNSTLAHEAGHILLHGHLFALDDLEPRSMFEEDADVRNDRILCRDSSSRRPWWEIQANKSMGILLMPRVLVQKAIQPYLTKQGTFGKPTVRDEIRDAATLNLSEIFDVSRQLAQIRMDYLYPKLGGQLTL